MKQYMIAAFLCICSAWSQELKQPDSIMAVHKVKKPYYERVMAEAGARIPMGRLADKFSISPEVGLWFRSRIYIQDMLDVGFTVYVPTENRPFAYRDMGQVYAVRPMGANGTAALRFCKPYSIGTTRLEWVSTFGYAFFMFRDRFNGITPNGALQKDNTKGLSTYALGQGIRVDLTTMMGIQAHYNYTPYGQLSKHVTDSFGSHSITLGLYYKQ
ncbi:MAG: hypothetical protein ACLGH8_11885 [Bacteroidia bacterium]